MVAIQSDAIRALKDARGTLLHASRQAAHFGQWPAAKKLVDLAERVDRLCTEAECLHAEANGQEPRLFALLGPTLESPLALSAEQQLTRFRQQEYPIYLVSDGVLIKRGLQRDGKHYYEHAVPKESCGGIVRQIQSIAVEAGGKARSFTIDEVQHGLSSPRYMTYVVAALLLRKGLMIRAGKGRYLVESPQSLVDDTAKLWDDLLNRTE
jgi:hypothetical protein